MTDIYGPDSNVLPPPRGLLSVTPIIHEGRMAIEVACDCATTCIVNFDCENPGEHLDGREIPYTCPGCLSVTWLTLSFKAVPGGS